MPELASLEQSYKRYALYERGHTINTVNQTLRIAKLAFQYSRVSQVEHMNTFLIREWLQTQREEKGWSAKTFRLYRQYLKTFFDWCESQQWITSNPVIPVRSPRLPSPLPRCLSKDEALKFLAHAHWYPWRYELEGSRNRAILATFLFTGVRLSELLNARMNDMDLEHGELRIILGKNEKSRTLALHSQLLPVLREYISARKRLGEPSIWLFPSVKSEKRLTVKNLHAIFGKISHASGIKVTPHMLRHTFGRLSVEANINIRVIQGMMGHSSISTTQIYTHVTTKAMRKALDQTSFL